MPVTITRFSEAPPVSDHVCDLGLSSYVLGTYIQRVHLNAEILGLSSNLPFFSRLFPKSRIEKVFSQLVKISDTFVEKFCSVD